MGRTACTEPQCLYKGDLYLFFVYNYTQNSLSLRYNRVQNYIIVISFTFNHP